VALDIFHLAVSSFAKGTIDEPLPEQTHSSATTEKAPEKILLMFPSIYPSVHFGAAVAFSARSPDARHPPLSFSYLINFPPNYISISHQCNTTSDALSLFHIVRRQQRAKINKLVTKGDGVAVLRAI
jgi:hypothetical protein